MKTLIKSAWSALSANSARRHFAWAIVFAAACFWPTRADACTCARPPLGASFQSADVVLFGLVTSVRMAQPNRSESEALTLVEIQVEQGWKNARGPRVTLHTQRNLYSCEGYEFAVGNRYAVFAKRNDPKKTSAYGLPTTVVTHGVSLCGGTELLQSPNHTRELELQLQRLAGK